MIDGIYFSMPEEVYHALPRLSVSGMQKLLVSPATFWAGSWLNPKKASTLAATLAASASNLALSVLANLQQLHPDMPEPDPEEAEESTKAQVLGKAYHAARLEPELLEERFVRALDKRDMLKGSLFTGTDMGKALEDLGEKKSGSVAEQCARLIKAGFDSSKLWHAQLLEWETERAGRTPIPAEFWDDIIADMELIRSTPEIAKLLTDGAAEVSILWTDARGISMKARLDYLRAAGWTDFKTFANPGGKHLEQCISDAFAFNRYHVQAAGYREAIEAIRTGAITIEGEAPESGRDIIAQIQLATAEPECWYVFQEKGGIPNLLAKRVRFHETPVGREGEIQAFALSEDHAQRTRELMERRSLWLVRAEREVRKAKRLFRAYSEIYSAGESWRPFNPVGELTDLSFHTHWLDEEVGE